MLADAHVHLFADGFEGELGTSPAGGDELAVYERLRARHSIERALVVAYEGESRYAGNTHHVLALARDRDWIVPLVYVEPGARPDLEALRSGRAAGIALYLPDGPSGSAFGDWPTTVCDEASAQRAIISLNSATLATAECARVLNQLEGCAVLFSHLGLPGRFAGSLADARERLRPLLELASLPNVAVKLSGLYAISEPAHAYPHTPAQPLVDVVLDAFGPSRLLWGSDFAPALDSISFVQSVDCRLLGALNPSERADVMGENLLRLISERDL